MEKLVRTRQPGDRGQRGERRVVLTHVLLTGRDGNTVP